MRKLIFGLIIVVALVVVFMRGDSFVQLVDTMQKGVALPLIFAVLSQLCKYFSQSFAFSNSFATVGEEIKPRHTINLVFGMFFMNTVAPSVGVSGIALVVDDARRRGVPAGRATSAALLMQISIDSGFLMIMTLGFIVLGITGQFNVGWLIFMLIVAVLVGLMVSLLILGRKRPDLLTKFFLWVEKWINKFLMKIKKNPLKPWAEKLVTSFGDAAGQIYKSPKKAAKVFLFSFIASLCELTCFILCGISFGVYLLPALIGGYVVATLFAMISITPQGVGFVEAAILVLMTAYGVSGAAATAVGIVYRGLVFWMPFAIG
ncbi:MAG: lysylphosphatidylglycerol synthase transmembrane domain-containing protein, partial [Coriobacteriales bacterium]